MVRNDNKGVDFGIWKNISPSILSCPLDVHSGNVARKLGHPVMQLEFNSGSMYACFEEAVSRAYVWRVQLAGNTYDWRFKKVALMARR